MGFTDTITHLLAKALKGAVSVIQNAPVLDPVMPADPAKLAGYTETTDLSQVYTEKAPTNKVVTQPTSTTVKSYTDCTSSLQKNTIAVVDNKTNSGVRAWATDYGYVHCTVPELEDGTVVFLDDEGNYTYYSDDEMSEDYKEQVDKFKLAHKAAEDEYAEYEYLQEIAANEAYNQAEYTSFLDLVCNAVQNASADEMLKSIKDIGFRISSLGRYDKVDEFSDAYEVDPLTAIRDLKADDTLSERERAWIAYKAINGGSAGAQVVQDVFTEIGEDMDWLANPIKGTMLWLSYRDGESGLDVQGKYKDYLTSHGLLDTIASCYSTSADNESRAWYNYDTGCIPLDFVLEVFADPEAWVSIAGAVANSKTATLAAQNLEEAGLAVQKKSALSYLTKSTDDILESFVKQFPEDAQAGVRKILADTVEYSNTYKIAKSLGIVKDAKQIVDDVLMSWVRVPKHIFAEAYDLAKDALNKLDIPHLWVKAFTDATAEACGVTGRSKVTIDMAQQVLDYASRNMSALCDVEEFPLQHLSKEDALSYIELVYADCRSGLKTDAEIDLLQKQTIRVLEAQGLKDSRLYSILTEASAPAYQQMVSSVPYTVPEWVAQANETLYDTKVLEARDAIKGLNLPEADVDKTIYTVKFGSAAEASEVMKCERLINFLRDTDFARVSTENSKASELFRELHNWSTSFRNYEEITEALNALPDQKFAEVLKDYMFNSGFNRLLNNMFDARTSAYGYTQRQLSQRIHNAAKAWVDGAFNLEVKYNDEWCSTFADLHCCDLDLSRNLENIKAQYEALSAHYKFNPDRTDLMYYTYSLDELGRVNGLVLECNGERVAARINEGYILNMHEVENFGINATIKARKLNKTVKCVGFNGHGTGFNADRAIMDLLSDNRATHISSMWRNTLDVADCLRAAKGMPVPTQDMYDTAETLMRRAVANWNEETLRSPVTSFVKQKFSLVPPKADDLAHIATWAKQYDALSSYEYLLNEMLAPAESLEYAYLNLHGAGRIAVGDSSAMRVLRKNFGHDYALHKVWEGKTVSKYFDYKAWADAGDEAVTDWTAVYDFCEELERSLKKVRPLQLSTFRDIIDEVFDALMVDVNTDLSRFSYDFLMNQSATPMTSAMLHATIQDWDYATKLAYIDVAVKRVGNQFKYNFPNAEKKINEVIFTYKPGRADAQGFTLFDFLTDQRQVLFKDNAAMKWFVADEKMPGNIGRTDTAYEQLIETGNHIKSMFDVGESVEAIDEYLLSQGISAPLSRYTRQILADTLEPLEEIRKLYEAYRDAANSTVNAMRTSTMFSDNLDMASAIADTHTGVYEKFNALVYDWSVRRLDARAEFITRLTSEEFDSFLWYKCNGRLVIDCDAISTGTQAKLRKYFDTTGKAYNFDGRYIKMLGSECAEVEVPTLEISDSIGDKLQDMKHFIRLDEELAKHTDDTFTYGDYVANNFDLQHGLDNLFFEGQELPKIHNTGGYLCSYIGDIQTLRHEKIGAFVSNNPMINIANAYTRVVQDNIDTDSILDLIFSGGKFKVQQQIADIGGIPDGYVIAGLEHRANGVLELVEYKHLKLAPQECALLTYNDFFELNNKVKHKVALQRGQKPAVLKALGTLQQMYISSYLFTNPATWIRNFVDSTAKGILSEDFSHLLYMKKAEYINKVWDDTYAEIVKRYEKFDADVVHDFFLHKGTDLISEDEFMLVLNFKRSPVVDGEIASVRKILDDLKGVVDETTESNTSFAEKFLNNPWFEFNSSKFEWVENTNRLAIYLNECDRGLSASAALKRVALSQFDYSKTLNVGRLNKLLPFTSFKLQNYRYWLGEGVSTSMRWFEADLMQMYNTDYDPDEWDEDAMRWRAYCASVCHSMAQLEEDYGVDSNKYQYNMFEDYKGTADETALEQGWIRIGDRLYFKLGLSMIDGFGSYSVSDNVFAPLKTLCSAEFYEGIVELAGVLNGSVNGSDWLSTYGYEVINMVPLAGTLGYRIMQTARNYNLDRREDLGVAGKLATWIPTLFAIGKEDKDYTKAVKQSYLMRAIGVNWFDREDHVDERFVQGLSHVASWVAKDPATYINTYGRLQQMGMTSDEVQKLMSDGGGLWFTMNNDGSYKLHNYKLMCDDEETYNKMFNDLLSFGWTPSEAIRLLNEAAEPTWTNTYQQYSNGSTGQIRGYKRYALAHTPDRYSGQYNIRSMAKGRYNTVSTPKVKTDKYNTGSRSYVRWHHRDTDIYHNLYAKYGASRIAMRQNPRAYSNRSITEMYRTNQTQAYARIHRRHGWY